MLLAPIQKQMDELNALVEKYPIDIPLTECAAFLHTNPDSLRCAIDMGRCPFAYGWKKAMKGNRAYHIPTIAFYLWITQKGASV